MKKEKAETRGQKLSKILDEIRMTAVKLDLETENFERDSWRHKVEKLVCVIEELIPLCKPRGWLWLPSAESVIRAENMVDEYRKEHPKMPDSQSPSDVAKRA